MNRVVVIGAGLGGTTLANAAAQHSEVTLLETGPSRGVRYPPLKLLSSSLSTTRTFCYGAGGTTNLWDNGLIPMRPGDIRDHAFREVLADAGPYMDQAASGLHFKPESYRAEYRKVHEGVSGLMADITGSADDLDCILYPKGHLPQAPAPAVTARFDVTGVRFRAEDRRIGQIEYRIGNDVQRVDCDQLVISAGSMGSPGLVNDCLEALGSPGGAAGQGFIDHPMGFVGKVRFAPDLAGRIHRFSRWDQGSYYSRHMIRLKSPCGLYTGAVFLRPTATMTNDPRLYRYKSSLGASRGLRRVGRMFSHRLFHPDVLAEIYQHLSGRTPVTRTFAALFITEQRPSTNSVRVRDGQVWVDWQVIDKELEAYRGMLEDLERLLKPVAEKLELRTELDRHWLWSGAHHSGTVAMGEGERGLVDPDLKLKSSDNVFVCDASVIPEHSYTNTGLTIAQLAHRLSDRIRAA